MKNILTFLALVIAIALVVYSRYNSDRAYTDSFNKYVTETKLKEYVDELCKPKYEGRLAGTRGMEKTSEWVAGKFKEFNLEPIGTSYIHTFPHPATEVSDADMSLAFRDSTLRKYIWSNDWYAGGTSGSGDITAEVVYAGFGVTAPELGYDDYAGIDVRGKIVLIEGETPNKSRNADTLEMWMRHSLHQTKHANAIAHGAIGMLYKWVCGPNNSYNNKFVYCFVSENVVNDIFTAMGRSYKQTVDTIYKTKKPQSFITNIKANIKANTLHYPDATGKNIVGLIPGSDPELSKEYVVVIAHIDHLGMIPKLMPGANDNATGTAAIMAIGEALSQSKLKAKRSIIVMLTDAEEAGLGGSTFYCKNPIVPEESVVAVINVDAAGVGTSIGGTVSVEYPLLGDYFVKTNSLHTQREIKISETSHKARPRTDGAVFMNHGYPTIDIGSRGNTGANYYHHPLDNINYIKTDILYDITKLVYYTTLDIANSKQPKFNK